MKRKITQSAFTLIELLVVMAIIVLMAIGISFLLNLNKAKNRVQISAKILASDIKRARDLTLNRKIDPTCQMLSDDKYQGQCLRYKIVLHYNSSDSKYLLLPQAIDHTDTNTILERFPQTILSLEEGTFIQEPPDQKIISFDYSPGPTQAIKIHTTISDSTISCEDPSELFEPIIISNKSNSYRVSLQLDCQGHVLIQESV